MLKKQEEWSQKCEYTTVSLNNNTQIPWNWTMSKDVCFSRTHIAECEIMWNANLMQQGNFIDVFLALHVLSAYANNQSNRCWVAGYGFLHRVCGWMVVLTAAA